MKHSVEEVKLKNGARGLFIDVPGVGVMNIRVIFRAGNLFVKDKRIYEVAHLMEHMAFGANAKFKDEQAYESEFTKNGAYHNAWTSDSLITYEAECADFEWERGSSCSLFSYSGSYMKLASEIIQPVVRPRK